MIRMEDAAELAERHARLQRGRRSRIGSKKSIYVEVYQDLSVNKSALRNCVFSFKSASECSAMINKEMVQLLSHDEDKFPIERKGSKAPHLDLCQLK